MRPSKDILQFQVGAFVTIGLFLVMMIIFLLGGEKKLFEAQYTLYTSFDNISGLRVGAPVQLAGIHAGSVNEIRFDGNLIEKKVSVVLRISTKYKDRIRSDSKATIMTQGLLGDKMVFVSVGSSEKKELQDNDYLVSEPSTDVGQLFEQGQTLLSQANEILSEIRDGSSVIHEIIYNDEGGQIVDNLNVLSKNLSESSEEVEDIVSKINSGEGTLGALVNDASLFNDIKTLLGKANRNKLVRAVIRYTLRTKEENLLKKEELSNE